MIGPALDKPAFDKSAFDKSDGSSGRKELAWAQSMLGLGLCRGQAMRSSAGCMQELTMNNFARPYLVVASATPTYLSAPP